MNKLCGGKTSCLAPVSSRKFGDPCPGTNKYLEIVYTCKHSYTSHSTPEIPDWLKHINMDPPISTVTTTTTTTTTSSTSALATTTTIQEKLKEYSPDVVSFNIFDEILNHSHLIQEESEEKIVFVNNPVEIVDTDALN